MLLKLDLLNDINASQLLYAERKGDGAPTYVWHKGKWCTIYALYIG